MSALEETHLNAYCLLAESIAHFVYRQAEADDAFCRRAFKNKDAPWPIFYGVGSIGERVAIDLERLGILKQTEVSCHVFACTLDEVISVARRNYSIGSSYDDLLKTFVNVYYNHGADYWGFGAPPRSPFTVRKQLIPLLDALVAAGDAIRVGSSYRWSERLQPLVDEEGYLHDWPPVEI